MMRWTSIHELRRRTARRLATALLLLPPAFAASAPQSAPAAEAAEAAEAAAPAAASPRPGRPAAVVGARVYARSGPGLHYYPCLTLREGMRVRIVEEADDGWCAVEPPPTAFCWVAAAGVRQVDDDFVEVALDKSVVRVGTSFSDARDVIQTYLPQGARARLLRDAAGAPGVDGWLRIHPPAGEVRWVPIEELELLPPEPAPAAAAAAALVAPPVEVAASAAASESVAASPATAALPSNKESPAAARPEWLPTKRGKAFSWMEDPEVRLALMDAPLPGPGEGGAAPQPAASASPGPPPTPAGAPAPLSADPGAAPAPRGGEADPNLLWEQRDELLAIQEAMVRITALSPTTWELEPLEQRIHSLIESADTALVRGEARAVAKQLGKLSELRKGYRQLDAGRLSKDREAQLLAEIERARTPRIRAVAGGPSAAPAGAAPPTAAPLPSAASATPMPMPVKDRPITPVSDSRGGDGPGPMSNASTVAPARAAEPPPAVEAPRPRYDAEGRLAENLEALTGQPRYVLRDEAGRNVAFLTPAPGVNLRRKLGKRVGVVGTKQNQEPGAAPNVQVRHLDDLPNPPATAAAPSGNMGR